MGASDVYIAFRLLPRASIEPTDLLDSTFMKLHLHGLSTLLRTPDPYSKLHDPNTLSGVVWVDSPNAQACYIYLCLINKFLVCA